MIPAVLRDFGAELTVHVSLPVQKHRPGLRYGFVVAPRALLGHIATALRRLLEHQSAHGAYRDHDSGGGSASKMIEAQRTELRARQTILRDVLLSLTFSPTRPRRARGFICRSRGGTWRSQEHAVKEALGCSQWRRSLSDISTRFASIWARALGWGF
jgi:hypothetical protein